MSHSLPRIAIPEPNSLDAAYSERTWPHYAVAVESSGGIPVMVSLGLSPAETAEVAASCSGVLLPGSSADIDPQKYGQDRHSATAAPDPLREAVDELLLQDAFNLGKPVFGICYGHQSLNIWKGGVLTQDLATSIDHQPDRNTRSAHRLGPPPAGSRLSTIIPTGACVNSSHHQAVSIAGDGLLITGLSAEDGVIEAVEGTSEQYVVGVQWHPERTYDDPFSRSLFDCFMEAAREWKLRFTNEVSGR